MWIQVSFNHDPYGYGKATMVGGAKFLNWNRGKLLDPVISTVYDRTSQHGTFNDKPL